MNYIDSTELSSFVSQARLLIGPIHKRQLLLDKHYSLSIFKRIDELGSEPLILQSLLLQNSLGLLQELHSRRKNDHRVSFEQKYFYGVRA